MPDTGDDRIRREYVALDLETTGLMAGTDRIVEIGAVRFRDSGAEVARFQRLVNPQRRMSAAAFAIHGLSDDDLADAPPAHEVLPEFLDFLGGPAATGLLAHNAAFDASFLGSELCRAGIAAPDYLVHDTLALARRRLPHLASHKLDVLTQCLGLDPDEPHRALADSLRVKALWLVLEGHREPPAGLVSFRMAAPPNREQAPTGWEQLQHAADRGLTVRIEYEGGTRGTAPRSITPRRFIQRGGSTYLVAFCHIDSLEKSFLLDRIRRFDVTAANREMRSG